MRKLVILGAGQMGSAAFRLLNEEYYELLAFGDNQGPYPRTLRGIPVLPVGRALALGPDLVLAAVASRERAGELIGQARALGYQGPSMQLGDLYEAIDVRRSALLQAAERMASTGVSGSIAELGVYRGATARILNRVFPDRRLFLFDTFGGFDACDLSAETASTGATVRTEEFSDTSPELVLSVLPHPEMAFIRAGHFPDTAEGLDETFAFVSLDADLFAPTRAGLAFFLPRLTAGGMILLHDYDNPRFPGVRRAVMDYEKENGLLCLVPLGDLHGSAVIVKGCS